jgi:hypothetical protein
MIYFFINIPLNEAMNLEDKLPRGCYCLFQMQNASSRFYGIMKKDSFPLLLQMLNEESKQNIETLDKNIFQLFFLQNISDSITYMGNRRLMSYISDEN